MIPSPRRSAVRLECCMTIRAFEGFEPALEHIFDLHIDLEAPQIVGQTPTGIRQIYVVKGGTADGPRLKADVLPGGGDWGIMRPDNFIQLDVRATMRADDGALIYSLLRRHHGRRAEGRRPHLQRRGRASLRVLLLHHTAVPDFGAPACLAQPGGRSWPRAHRSGRDRVSCLGTE
jgi:uncharacterized protein DUF3237